MSNGCTFKAALAARIDAVFKSRTDLFDHRRRFPWLTGNLGDPFSGVFFVAENPSLGQVERAVAPGGGEPTEEAQWFASRGDRLFRDGLVATGFKHGAWDGVGGWHCYITNLIKEADYAERWKSKEQSNKLGAAEAWSDVFCCELETARPRLVVLMGRQVRTLAAHLQTSGLVQLPEVMHIDHYSYIAFRPAGRRGPMHPERVAAYRARFAAVRLRLDASSGH